MWFHDRHFGEIHNYARLRHVESVKRELAESVSVDPLNGGASSGDGDKLALGFAAQ
jgi:hypothetical protein